MDAPAFVVAQAQVVPASHSKWERAYARKGPSGNMPKWQPALRDSAMARQRSGRGIATALEQTALAANRGRRCE